MSPHFNPRRRQWLRAAAALGLAAAGPAIASPQTVTVLTSYPDEFVTRIQAAFEKANPAYRMQVVWRMPNDAHDYLSAAGQNGVDVYWAASTRNFARLAAAGIWQKLPVDRSSLPAKVGNTPLLDEQGCYAASEIAGFGFAIDPRWLAANNLPVPGDWDELVNPRLAGRLALPNPARVGFAPPMVEIVLQAWGWERGWALWSEIAANAAFVDRGSTFVSDEITSGRAAIGLSIDFFVNAAIAGGAPLQFIYPRHTGINPAHIAVTRRPTNQAGAQAFVNFILSLPGQQLLAHPDIRRQPVHPDAYAARPAGSFDPFRAAQTGGLQFDSERARPRLAASSALFEQMLVLPQAELRPLWRRLQAAEAAGKPVAAIRQRLGQAVISEAEADDPALHKQLGLRLEGNDERPLSAPEKHWQALAATQRAEVAQALTEIGA